MKKFANWYFETQLLGYSYSQNLRDVFQVAPTELKDALYFDGMDLRDSAQICRGSRRLL